MNEQSKNNEVSPQTPAAHDILILIKKIEERLVSLEKKIDTLISGREAKPFSGRPFSKPYRSFDRQDRHSSRGHFNPPGERSFSRQQMPFEKRPEQETRAFGHKKTFGDESRPGNFGEARTFEKRRRSHSKGFEQKKPFPFKHREHR